MKIQLLKLITAVLFMVLIGTACGGNTAKENALNIVPAKVSPKEMVAEMVFGNEKEIDLGKINSIIKNCSIHTDSIYQWKNHVAIFDAINDTGKLRGLLITAFPGSQLNIYCNPFYEFNRMHCDSLNMAKNWDNILLTANLVADTVLQNQYLNYHTTQFEKWPEVAKGFCNANFQQLLVYKNKRQLMLVISLPKGESLDKLNPKTTENNPRVNDWNKMMQKYQEGIAGTAKGETWIFLKGRQVGNGK